MSNSKMTKKVKRRLLLLGTSSVIAIILITFSIFNYWVEIYKKAQQKQFFTKELVKLREQEDNLKSEIQKLQDPDYIARYAREKYLYSKDGEFIIRIP
jgi:cell division protein DivIC